MRVFTFYVPQQNAYTLCSLEGPSAGWVIATAERVVLRDAVLYVSSRRRTDEPIQPSVIGHIESLHGVSLKGDISNDTINDMRIGKPWLQVQGRAVDFMRYPPETVLCATLARLDLSGMIWAEALVMVEEACLVGCS